MFVARGCQIEMLTGVVMKCEQVVMMMMMTMVMMVMMMMMMSDRDTNRGCDEA